MTNNDIMEYVRQSLGISRNNKQAGYLLLDHRWQNSIGDFEFDRKWFPNPNQFVKELR